MSGALRNRPVVNRDPMRYAKRERRRKIIGGWLCAIWLAGVVAYVCFAG